MFRVRKKSLQVHIKMFCLEKKKKKKVKDKMIKQLKLSKAIKIKKVKAMKKLSFGLNLLALKKKSKI